MVIQRICNCDFEISKAIINKGRNIILKTEHLSRISWLDILKGMGIIFVVIGHIYSNSIVFNWLYSFHMPLFFFVAGWLYRKKPITADLRRRIQTIIVPYYSFGFIIFIYWAVIERRFRDSSMGILDSFIGLLRGEHDYLDFNVHLWFLPCFFMTVVIYNLLVNINKKVAYGAVIIMSIIFIAVPLPQLFYGIDRMFKYIGFYAVGNILAKSNTDKVLQKIRMPIWWIVGIILMAANFVLSYYGLTNGIMWFVTGSIGVASTAIISILIDHSKVLQYLGRISLVVLCIHGPVYRVLIKIVSIPFHMSTDQARGNFILAMIIVSLTLIICAAIYEVVSRVAPWMIGKKREMKKV